MWMPTPSHGRQNGWNPFGQHGLASGFWEGFAWNGSRSPLVSLGYIEIQDERGRFYPPRQGIEFIRSSRLM